MHSNYQAASNLLEKAADLYLKCGKWAEYVKTLNKYSENLNYLSKPAEAIVISQKVLNLRGHFFAQNDLLFHTAYTNLAFAYGTSGRLDDAGECYYQSLKICERLLEVQATEEVYVAFADSLSNIGWYHSQKGALEQALNYHHQSLAIYDGHLQNHTAKKAIVYNNIGYCFGETGDHVRAMMYYKKTANVWQSMEGINPQNLAYIYNNIGWCYRKEGSYSEAEGYYLQALDIQTTIEGDSSAELATTYNNLAACYSFLQQYEKAVEHYYKALEYTPASGEFNQLKAAQFLANIGACYTELKRFVKAESLLNEAIVKGRLALGKSHPELAFFYNQLGNYYRAKHEFDKAIQNFQHAIVLLKWKDSSNIAIAIKARKYHFPRQLLYALHGEAESWLFWFQMSGNTSHLMEAFPRFILVLELVKQIKEGFERDFSKITLAKEVFRAFENAMCTSSTLIKEKIYKFSIFGETWSKHAILETAFRFSEEYKAVLLNEAIIESKAKVTAGLPKELLQKEKEIKAAIAQREKQINLWMVKPDSNQTEIKHIEDELFELRLEYEKVIEQFEKDFPAYFHLKYNHQPITIRQVQQQLNQVEATRSRALLSYFTTTSTIFLFVIKTDDAEMLELTKPGDFEELVDELREAVNWADIITFTESAHRLYQVLIMPAERHLKDIEEVIIIGDESLLKLPFELLLTESPAIKKYSELPYLIRRFTISYHYSATLWLTNRLDRNNEQPGYDFSGFAPVTFSHITDTFLPDLPYTKDEIERIASMLNWQGKATQLRTGNSATVRSFMDEAGDCRILHIASHGYLLEEQQQLAGFYLFGKSAQDSIFYTFDAYNLHLKARLVVLSCCETGLGEIFRGEGVMAINRGFLYAGASNILFTLFDLPDEASGKLMLLFYENLLESDDLAHSLREAKLQLIENEKLTPHDWAAFVLIGGEN